MEPKAGQGRRVGYTRSRRESASSRGLMHARGWVARFLVGSVFGPDTPSSLPTCIIAHRAIGRGRGFVPRAGQATPLATISYTCVFLPVCVYVVVGRSFGCFGLREERCVIVHCKTTDTRKGRAEQRLFGCFKVG